MTARRLLLSTAELEALRRVATPHADLPPGFALEARGDVDAALARLGTPHPTLVADLRLLAAAEAAVVLRAARPGLEATAFLAVAGTRGVGLLRTDDAHVQLSAFRSCELGVELARVVPAPTGAPVGAVVEVALAALLADRPGGRAAALHARSGGSLHATVVGRRPGASVQWVWLATRGGGAWAGLEPVVDGRPEPVARVVPVVPGDLGTWLGPGLAQVLADRSAA